MPLPTPKSILILAGLALVALPGTALAQSVAVSPDSFNLNLGMESGSASKAVSVFLLLTFLSIVPALVMMMTSFIRIVVVLAFLKQALGLQQAPSTRVLSALALFLTIFIMQPVWEDIYNDGILPYSNSEIDQTTAMTRSSAPIKAFMLRQTRESTLLMFMDMAGIEGVDSAVELPMRVVVPAFMLSELKTAFQMGFLLYLPFLVVDVVVATILMSMGMIMLPPMMISLPFKVLLFIMVDGWDLLVRTLVMSFY